LFADELVGREAFEGLQSSPEVVGADEVGHVISELVVVVVVEAFDCRLLDRPIHPFNLAIGPRVFDPGKPVVDLMLSTDTVKDVLEGINVLVMIGELDAIIGQNDVEPVGHGGDQVTQEGCGGHLPGLLVQFNESELGSAVDGDEEIQLALSRLNLSDINMEVAERVGSESVRPSVYL
jgi:hypothetical protein